MLPLNLRQEIMNHLESGDKESGLPLAQSLAQKFPKYVFHGVAHRSVLSLEEIGEIKLNPGDSFTSKTDSIDQFFKDNQFEAYDDINGVVVEAEITGFDLCSFLKNEMNQFPSVDQEDLEIYLNENEVIAIEIHKVIKQEPYKP